MTHRHRQRCGEGQGKGRSGAGCRWAKCGEMETYVRVSTVKNKAKKIKINYKSLINNWGKRRKMAEMEKSVCMLNLINYLTTYHFLFSGFHTPHCLMCGAKYRFLSLHSFPFLDSPLSEQVADLPHGICKCGARAVFGF